MYNKENVRSISLMSQDTKALNKIFSNWSQEQIENIIHHGQVGFILQIHLKLNMHKSPNVIHCINRLKDR